MRTLAYLLLTTACAVAACGGDDGGATPDAGTDAPVGGVCGVEAITLSTYPATFTGTVLNAGDDLDVIEGACADERGYWGPYGLDQVVALTGLTAGTAYVVELDTAEDLGVYVTSTCDAGGPATGSCLLLVDETVGAEIADFVAPAGGAVFLVIDTADAVSLTDGAYTLAVRAAECTTSAQCTTAGAPICNNYECVQCTTSFQCSAAGMPVCDGATSTCVAGGTTCTGDDAGEPDDGPAAARTLTFPTMVTPTVVTAAVCSQPAVEGDWYKVTAVAAGQLRLSASWTTSGADLDFVVYNSIGAAVGQGAAGGAGPEVAVVELAAPGEFFIEVYQYEPVMTAAATGYTLTLSLPECRDSFGCTNPAEPMCAVGDCVVGPAQCTGDDAADSPPGDDGPAGSRNLTAAVGTPMALSGRICNTPGTEQDWYRVVTTSAGEGIQAELAWIGTPVPDLDVFIFDSQGRLLGTSFWLNPESVTLTYLPAGTYYLRVNLIGTTTAAAHDYTITATRTTAVACTTRTDCATTFKTQLYRGACTAGSCQFIAPGMAAEGGLCDSADDCTSRSCSYIAFEADAQDSVCTHACTTTADCSSLGAGFACTSGFGTNICVPTCTADVECGANVNSSMVDLGQPWNYFTCATATGVCSP